MKIIYVLVFLLSIVLISCKHNNGNDSFSAFTQLQNVKEGSRIYVIPGSGCTGCISNVEAIALDNLNSDSLYFIFTKIHSLKLLRNRFGHGFYNSHNVILDIKNIFQYENEQNSIYPVLYKIVDGKIKLQSYMKP